MKSGNTMRRKNEGKMKKTICILLAMLMVLSLAACGQTAAPAAEKPAEQPAAEPAAEPAEETNSESASEPAVELEDTLIVYSTHSEKLLAAVADAFEEKTGVHVECINLKGGLADRVRGEKENPQADVMYGGDSATYTILQGEGLFEPTFPSWKDELDPAFKAEDGSWYGTIKTPVLLFYNKDIMTAEEAPKDWFDLVNPEYAGKIVVRDSGSSSMRSTICNLIDNITATQGEEAAWEFVRALDANVKGYYASGSMMYSAVSKGEAAISWAVLSDIVTNRDDNGMPFEIIDAASGAVVLTDCIAAIKNAPHPNAAAAFVEFAGSKEVQVMLANEFSRNPTLASALPECPDWMQTDYSALPVDWANISNNQLSWIEQWQNDVIDSSKNVAKD